MKSFKELTKAQIISALSQCSNYGQVLNKLECHDNTSNRNKLKQFIEDNKVDVSHFKFKLTKEQYKQNPKHCKYCGKEIDWKHRVNDFCNHSCSASYNNQGICRNGISLPEHSYCLNCSKEITRGNKYCNNICQSEFEHKEYIKRWKNNEESGIIGKDGISNHIRRYLFKTYGKCQCCGWNKVNPYTNLIPLQIHHIDGDCLNNKENNLQLLCPNCHSLTENFGSRNKNATRIDKRIR